MFNKPVFSILVLALAAVGLAACGALTGGNAPAATPTTLPPVEASTNVVVDGRLVPNRSVDLSFGASGSVAEVLVAEGETVKTGEVIARLGNREPLAASVASASLELLSARQELLAAQDTRLTLFEDLSEAQTVAMQAVTDARAALHEAERTDNSLNTQAARSDIDAAWANVVLTQDRLDKAREDYQPYENKPEDNLTRAAFLSKLSQAQNDYDAALRLYNNLVGSGGNEFDRQQAKDQLAIAQARLAQAEDKYARLQKGPDSMDVSQADARIETAKGRISAAEASLTAAQAALADLDLVATIDGTLVKNDLIPGQQVTAGQTVVQLVDFSQWFVETDNLTELDVVRVAHGQKAAIVPDAVPGLQLFGNVDTIDDVYEEKRGDITYTARILLDEPDPRLRWGMTVTVTFQE
jgi:multidrug efflux pump subunit AcrA (membrane-fusion protein)